MFRPMSSPPSSTTTSAMAKPLTPTAGAAMPSSATPAIATSSRCCPSSIRPRPRYCPPRSSDLLAAQAMDPRTHQGSVSLKHLDGYLEEFPFRFNRRRARRITHGAERLLAIAMTTPPRPFRKIVGRPRPQGKTRLPSQPDDHGDPFGTKLG